jgi:hypothetical protein
MILVLVPCAAGGLGRCPLEPPIDVGVWETSGADGSGVPKINELRITGSAHQSHKPMHCSRGKHYLPGVWGRATPSTRWVAGKHDDYPLDVAPARIHTPMLQVIGTRRKAPIYLNISQATV